MFSYSAPTGTMIQEMSHDDKVFLVRKGLLRPRLELENVAIAALLIRAPWEVICNPGPFFTTRMLCTHHEKLVFFLGPGDLAFLFFVVFIIIL